MNNHAKQLLRFGKKTKVNNAKWLECATSFWIENNSNGDSVYIRNFGDGWVCQIHESYLTKKEGFKFKGDIPSFEFSMFMNFLQTNDKLSWEHIFKTKEKALKAYIKHKNDK